MADNKTVKEAIKAYLDNRAATDELFAVNYVKEGKSIDECYRYILGEARKRGSAVCMTDDEVFGMAVHYYDEDNIKVAPAPAARVTHSAPAPAPVELSEQEKEAARESARKAYEQQCLREEAERDARRRKAEAERKKAEAEKKAEQRKQRQSMFTAPSLFDL